MTQTQNKGFMAQGWAWALVAAAVTACGGGSSDAELKPPPRPLLDERIEPFDPGAASMRPAQAPAVAALPALAASAVVPTVALTALAPLSDRSVQTPVPGMPLQVGVGRALAKTASSAATQALLHWQPEAQGAGQVAALAFVSEGALALRLGLQIEAMPPGTVLRFHGAANEPPLVLPGEQALEQGAGAVYWSPEVTGSRLVLEVHIPAQARPAAVRLAVPQLSHTTVLPGQERLAKAGESSSCEVNLMCQPQYLEQSRSMARMRYVARDGNAYQCTGTLLNDATSSGTPHLLTAHHCISDSATAATLTTDWFYRASACTGNHDGDTSVRLRRGATLLYTDAGTDVTLLRLNEPVPAGVVFAGSYFGANAVPGQSVATLHHPWGDWLKISRGAVTGYHNCSSNFCSIAGSDSAGFSSVRWQQGVIEPGSSGAGVFMDMGARRYLVGQLFGGTSSCANPGGTDYFGRYSVSYRSALHRWLNP